MKNCNIWAVLALSAVLVACEKKATVIEGTLTGAPDREVVVKLLDVNRLTVVDTVKTDAAGTYRCALDIAEGRPEFIYVYYGDRKVGSLLLEKGDRVKLVSDTLGTWTVSGSGESEKLQQVEQEYASFLVDMNRILQEDDPSAELSRRYVQYYRDRVAYVIGNAHSLTVIPVLYQQVGDDFPVFNQPTDGLLMASVADSLKEVYPESRYVQDLEKEAARRMNVMSLSARLLHANPVGFFDVDLPGIDGKSLKLSEVDGKVVMVYFWATTAAQKMFNLDALIPLYREFHPKGFEIYAVSLDVDKSVWAAAVRNQDLPWMNVCDTRGNASPYVSMYGVQTLPTAYFIVDGDIDPDAAVSDAASIRKYLQGKL